MEKAYFGFENERLKTIKENFIKSYNIIKNGSIEFFNVIVLKFNELAEKEKKE